MMIKLNMLLFMSLAVFTVNAQIAVFKKESIKPVQLTYYSLNHLGETSSIGNNEVAKETLLKTFTFKDPFLGEIESYDERNPLQQLVFYKNTQHVILLDNQLSLKEKINFTDRFPEIDPQYVALSGQASIWVFDQTTKRWCLIASNANSPKFVTNPIPTNEFVTTSGNFAYWQIGNVILGIDIYGNLLEEQILPIRSKLLAVNGDYYIYKWNKGVFILNSSTKETQRLREINDDVEKAIIVANNISLLSSQKLYLYTLN